MSSTFDQHGSPDTAHQDALHQDRPAPGHSQVAPGEIAVGVVIGRASEYFDFFVFGIASVLVFPSVFFPFRDRLHGLLLSFVVFALAFVARPFGTALFMTIQRRWSRGTKLTAALFLLGSATVGMAFLPGFDTLGWRAIALLAFFRLLQGIAFGGSWDGLPSLLALNTPKGRRGWYAMLGQLGAPIGFMLASGLFLFLHSQLSSEDFLSWGWRYPFFVAFAINVVALFARLRLVVTEEYTQALEESALEPIGIFEMLRKQDYNIFLGAFAALASYALFHLVTVFPLSWISLGSTQSVNQVLLIQVVGAGVGILGTIASGFVADRIGRRTTLGTLAALIGLFSFFAPWLLGGSRAAQDAFILIGFALLGLSYGQSAGTVTSNFPIRFRYTGAALTADVAWLIGAAFAPLVALGLSSKFGLGAVTVYLLSGAICTLGALRLNRALEARD
ncbi:MFS transporter [Dyella sp. LX-66]|uniref:MFS transporter n=1 Tax=unclassified Dyella TaxID=2634549 RepID=UPI001BDFAD13|nr:MULTISPECIES: MFS transporter [unclassified Dyella]MBT2118127.1 MFS transporter [Dyella sp. LX-1]MBT2138847.1 MFS transporter [Dyella sp. LX-66]